jgi:hypothetical protein
LIIGTCFDNWYLIFYCLYPLSWLLVCVLIIGTCFDCWYPLFWLLVCVLIIGTFLIVGTCCLHYWCLFLKLFLPALLNIGACVDCWYPFFNYWYIFFKLFHRTVSIIGTCSHVQNSYFKNFVAELIFTSAVHDSECLPSCPGRLTLGRHWIEDWMDPSSVWIIRRREKSLALTGIRTSDHETLA